MFFFRLILPDNTGRVPIGLSDQSRRVQRAKNGQPDQEKGDQKDDIPFAVADWNSCSIS
jgi:hypothetical protein